VSMPAGPVNYQTFAANAVTEGSLFLPPAQAQLSRKTLVQPKQNPEYIKT
jgi:hypothetical protein